MKFISYKACDGCHRKDDEDYRHDNGGDDQSLSPKPKTVSIKYDKTDVFPGSF